MSRTFAYIRVRTEDQSLDLQTDAIRKACDNAFIFQEKASGNSADRPELNRMLEQLRESDVVIVWKLDRLGRSTKDLIYLVETFREKGVDFISLQEKIDTTSATGEMLFTIMAALAQFERSMIVERTRAGLKSAKARGRVGGRPKALNDNQIEDAKLMREHGRTLTEIAQHFNIAVGTVHKQLTR